MKLHCMVVDDDPVARKMLKNLCQQRDEVTLVASCSNAEEAFDVFPEERIDLIFLDVEMPGMSGLEFLEKLPYHPQVIVTTVNKEYAFDAFQYQVTDFLHKPIHLVRFMKALDKALMLNKPHENRRAASRNIYVKEEGQYVRLELEDIYFFENVGDYVRIYTTHGPHLVYSTLKSIEEKLKDARFLRVHRSYIINLDMVKDIKESTLVIDRHVIPVSRSNRPVLMSRINIL